MTLPDQGVRAEILVRLGATVTGKKDAINQAGQLLVAAGCVEPAFVESMFRREETAETYLGAGVAIPHGTLEDKHMVRHDVLAVLQVPDGLDWGAGQRVHLVVGIAARSDSHIVLLRRLANLIQDEKRLSFLGTTKNPQDIRDALGNDGGQNTPPAVTEDFPDRFEWVLDYPSGLHARPASVWMETARAAGMPMRIRIAERTADPRNLLSCCSWGRAAGKRWLFPPMALARPMCWPISERSLKV